MYINISCSIPSISKKVYILHRTGYSNRPHNTISVM